MIKKLIVHSGVFHADDVMCAALIKSINPDVVIERKSLQQITDEEKNDHEVIIADIGYGEFDHHQADAKLRDDGFKYAACGLVFEKFKDEIFPDKETAESFRKTYIIPIENVDNGVEGSTDSLSSAIVAFRPNCFVSTPETVEVAFQGAVDFIFGIVYREIWQAKATVEAKKQISIYEEMSPNGLLILDKYFPVSLLVNSKIILEVSKSLRGGYQLSTIKKEEGSLVDKLQLPESWLTEKPDGCTFMHQARFIASFETKEQAVAAAESIIV